MKTWRERIVEARASAEFGLRYNDLETRLREGAMRMLMGRRMVPFRHRCAPCDTCGSTGLVLDDAGEVQTECPTCEGRSRACDCDAEYDREGDRRYEQWRDRQDEREERILDDD